MFCSNCGAPNGVGAKFCTECGTVLARPVVAPQRVPTGPATVQQATPPQQSMPSKQAVPVAPPGTALVTAQQIPQWLLSDWIIVVVCAVGILVVSAVLGAVFGAVLGLTTTSSASHIVGAALRGVYLTFTFFGVKTAVGSASDKQVLLFGTSFLPLPGVLVPVGATWFALRFALSRVRPDRANAIAFAVKLALVTGILLSIAAALMTVGHASSLSTDTDLSTDLVAKVSAGSAFLYAFLVVALVAFAMVARSGRIQITGRAREVATSTFRALAIAGRAFALLTVAGGLLATVFAVIVADSGAERLTIIVATPLIIVNVGIAVVTIALGGSVRFTSANFLAGNGLNSGLSGHVSLMHFGFPAAHDAGSAPIFWFVLVLAPLVAVGWSVMRQLDKVRPSTEQAVLGVGLQAAIGFAAIAWVASIFGRVELVGLGIRHPGNPDGVAGSLLLRPSAGAAIGLGLVWGLIGGLGAALWWGSTHGFKWSFLEGSAAKMGSGAPTDPVAHPTPAVNSATPAIPISDPSAFSPGVSNPPSDPWASAPTPPVSPPPPAPEPSGPAPVSRTTAPAPGSAQGSEWWVADDAPTKPVDRATQPATQLAAQPATQPATQPAAQPATQPETRFCTNCGTGLDPGSAFCTSCGARAL
jgi:hypothetical protein